MEGELRDDQWVRIAPLLPPHKTRGRPRADDRQTINGILWVLRSGASWRDLPSEYGSPSTCHRRFQEWQDQGVWEYIWLTFLATLDQQGKLDWSQAFLDGSFVPAKKEEWTSPMAGRARGARSISCLSGDGGQCVRGHCRVEGGRSGASTPSQGPFQATPS